MGVIATPFDVWAGFEGEAKEGKAVREDVLRGSENGELEEGTAESGGDGAGVGKGI